MKREGRQHGMVRTYRILPSPFTSGRVINRSDAPTTAGLFTKVHSHPTNHSKFTGKCGKSRCHGCHMHPSHKSKDKTKGTHKLKSLDVVSDCRLITWRVVDARPGLSFSGFSATAMLDHLDHQFAHDGDQDDESEYGYDESESELESESEIELDGNDDDMSFCDLGLDNEVVEDEGWCLVAV
ncbi:hypothetical protein M5689_022224 [Euphorbia peplus]|nr:hypothetical protein M5689_022224 [Euphorbia peplus]